MGYGYKPAMWEVVSQTRANNYQTNPIEPDISRRMLLISNNFLGSW